MLPDSHFYSTLLGYISLATCVAIALPQAFLHWRRKSAKGISLTMLWLWLIGDIASLIGTVIQGLLHTLIILGVINGLIDILLIWQCYHYAKWQQFAGMLRYFRRHEQHRSASSPLDRPPSTTPTLTTMAPSSSEKSREHRSTFYHILYVLLVVGISIMVWGLVVARVRKTANLRAGEDGTDPEFEKVGAVFGWLSMFIYTTSRYPQIYKNWKSKSCHNLSIWIFVLLIIYNITNIASILVKSAKKPYLIVNLPWIVNSGFNVILDLIIMGQFGWYRKVKRTIDEPTTIDPRPELVDEERKETV
ncbi:Protein RTC2 OS=Saccharomyces cerevisiae (strain ATCC 204508 / S288c) GN=RTC2 PE=1 SV=1 [Rhizoctonia solani AG-1 IB]|uniref:Protein RTC2 n=1 Tax=Thanatephorus cucumeris (strain AG1-IB / isolate 7/3/14) TaxID=1108050 RepID=A0A0B7FCU1_THACB|nr:Protein RTC2 OS=Saccharomyces cerevisiae (strain ATCC 204508 / S288c) GN=RTC2 PE=1 SV=1 [Rhizoctonia solani AG-1 IB]